MFISAQSGLVKFPIFIFIAVIFTLVLAYAYKTNEAQTLTAEKSARLHQLSNLESQLSSISGELTRLQNTDQTKRNDALESEIKSIESTYKTSIQTYQSLQDLKLQNPKLDKKFDAQMAQVISQLADKNFTSASATLKNLNSQIKSENDKIIAASAPPPPQAPISNSAPGSGFSRQTVHTDQGDYVVDLVAADLSSTRVIVDTASDGDCKDNCPVIPLSDYVARNGAYAGINGSYFCPADYPSCAGKTNSFDLLAMNKNKHYLNSENNVYSQNPAVIFGGSYIRFVDHAQEWGRDTGVDGVLSNFPRLLSGGNIAFSDAGDAKMASRGNRSFVANKGNTVYIGVNHDVTVAQSAVVLKALGMENAINLDSGGSTALWFGGYKAGPGRNLPNAILFVRK